MKTLLRLSAALAILLTALPALAGTQGRVTGKVTDSAGNPVEGVTVTVTTPAIKTFKLSTKTSSDGRYGLIVNDATLLYRMRFEKDGYVPAEAEKKLSTVEIKTVDQTLLKTSEAPAGKGAPAAAAAPSGNEQAVLAYNSAIDLMNSGDKAGAEAKFREAVAKNADLPQGWRALTELAYDKKDWAHVLEYGQKATDLDPTLTSLYGKMADAALGAGDKKAAADFRKKFEDANPDTPEMLYNKGIDSFNKKKWKDAEDSLSKAVGAKPDFALAHYYLALSAMNNKHNAIAREHFQKYLELDPNGSEAGTAKELLPLVK
ncbi:MAG: tetratricopeptide repeat protein [Acidobacteriota bacterium]|nr:tetratricopeptide repeat protein [Acidobacteriota bacterium]MDQ2977724.1 tetratricopeptide repeat protein [Acidobacteriota bacterium]